MKGTIFDIQKFALHDGPGIRTVVFLKGCIFRCAWCCNPESQRKEPQLAFIEERCNYCGKCIPVCERKVFSSFLWKFNVDFDSCTACGKCLDVCARQAIKIYGREMESAEIITEVLKDRSYYKKQGGGVTFSGGDPLYQYDFLLELLLKSKDNGLDTCIESEGYGTVEQFSKLLPLVDCFYFDYKITDKKDHLKYIKYGNEKILENLHYLCMHGANVVLRCIILPGINDNSEHFEAIAYLGKRYATISRIEVFGYHNWGEFKYKQLGLSYPFKGKTITNSEQVEQWIKEIKSYGYTNIMKG